MSLTLFTFAFNFPTLFPRIILHPLHHTFMNFDENMTLTISFDFSSSFYSTYGSEIARSLSVFLQ